MTACPDGFLCLQLKDIINFLILVATIIAIYLGPIRAVEVSKRNDERREKRNREADILANLMKTRRMTLDPLHVSTLNLVELEFHDNPAIVNAYRAYIANLNTKDVDLLSPTKLDELIKQRTDIFFDLVHAIGSKLQYSFDKRDLNEFSYSPQGWANTEQEQQTFRRLMIQILLGKRGFPIKQFNSSESGDKFPPQPRT